MTTSNHLAIAERLKSLRLYGCLQNLETIQQDDVLQAQLLQLLQMEETERHRRTLTQRLSATRIQDLEPVSGFDWSWPEEIDRSQIADLLTFEFLKQKTNIVFLGTAGLGKTMLAQNLVHEAARKGHSAMFIEAVELLGQLLSEDSRTGLDRLLKKFAKPALLAIDEVGYLSYDSRHADLLLRVIHMRHKQGSTAITTNRPFSEWVEMFPNAASVTALVDRLTENCEVVQIKGRSYRGKRALERNAARKQKSSLAKSKLNSAKKLSNPD